jgi:hypothetical protein
MLTTENDIHLIDDEEKQKKFHDDWHYCTNSCAVVTVSFIGELNFLAEDILWADESNEFVRALIFCSWLGQGFYQLGAVFSVYQSMMML